VLPRPARRQLKGPSGVPVNDRETPRVPALSGTQRDGREVVFDLGPAPTRTPALLIIPSAVDPPRQVPRRSR
jgi:hypothetical protein